MKIEHIQAEINFPVVTNSNIGQDPVQTVNARDLHSFLQVGKVFAAWIRERIEQYGFIEGRDFIEVISETGKNSSGGRPARDYHISLDMAKEMSMVERNEKGKQARTYFIEMERKAKAAVPALTGPQLMAVALIEADATMKRQSLQIEAMKIDVAAHERLAKADGSLCFRDSAKSLQVRPIDLTHYMATHRWTYRQSQNGPWLAYQDKINAGYLEHKVTTVDRSDGTEKAATQCRITPKGLSKLAKLIGGAA